MSGVFELFFLLALGFFIWGLISPQSLSKQSKKPITRKSSSLGFGIIALFFLILGGITAPPSKTTPKTSLNINETAQKNTNYVTTKYVTETQSIAYTSTNQDDSSLDKGQTQVAQAGQDGVKTLTYKVTYTNGQQTSKTLVSANVTTQPVNEIVDVGTYVAPAPQPTSSESSTTSTNSSSSQSSCYPIASSGNCYEPGEYCSNADHGMNGVAGDGKTITCEYNNGWRWEPS